MRTPAASLLGFLTLLGLLGLAAAQTVHDLGALPWTLSSAHYNISIPAQVPGQAHLALAAAKVTGDPYWGLNDFWLRWVAWANWTYTSAPLPDTQKPQGRRRRKAGDGERTWLVFQGLDTFASVYVCDTQVAYADNQFRQWWVDVTEVVAGCEGETELRLEFGSAPAITKAIAEEPGQISWPGGVENLYEFHHRPFMRKEQNDFGWDWGPAFAPAGPWQPVYMVRLAPGEVYVRNTLVDVYRKGQRNNRIPDQSQPWVVNASLDLIGALPAGASFLYELKDARNKTVSKGKLGGVTSREGSISGHVSIPSEMVELWWPLDMGPQTLYHMTLTVKDGRKRQLASITKRIGFRTIVLNGEEISQAQMDLGIAPGANWHFEINGHEFFAKGSNFIPPDAFWPRVTRERIDKLLSSVVEARQNMLRVWSSGAYSPDFMYDLADEKGVLLWSEFEFSDALYPVNPEFLDNVFQEAEYQVRRTNHHPSLAFWAGGNELESLELGLLNGSTGYNVTEYIKYKDQYEKLFLSTIFPAVFENSRSISYSPSSTSNGWISLNFTDAPYMQERYENLKQGWIYGESDYYNYNTMSAFHYQQYPIGRFTNEFGFQSMPSLQSWQQAVAPEDLRFNSTIVRLRNHHPPAGDLSTDDFINSDMGMAQMTTAVEQWYPAPNKTDPVKNFAYWCLATQIFQADYYVSQIAFYRRGSGKPERNLGSLYWQLEDIWQAPTWAGIEYDGRWKMLHYRGKDIYSHVIVSPFFDTYGSGGNLELWATSDLWEPVTATVDAQWYSWRGDRIIGLPTLPSKTVQIGAINSTKVWETDTTKTLTGYDENDIVMRMSITAQGHTPNSDVMQTFTHTSWFHPKSLATANLVDPWLTVQYSHDSDQFTVTAKNGTAAWVWLDYPAGAVVAFDDNGFWLRKGESKEIGYVVKTDTTGGKWIDGVTVQSLWDNTQP